MSAETRRCWRCRKTKPLTAFARDNTSQERHRRSYLCRPCSAMVHEAWWEALSPAERRRIEERRLRRERERRRARKQADIATVRAMIAQLDRQGLTTDEIARRAGLQTETIVRWRDPPEDIRSIARTTIEKISAVYLDMIEQRTRGMHT